MSIAKDFANSIKDATKEKTSSYDTQATVTRIEGKTAWVHIPGGVNETPVQLTVNASEGDAVQVRVANGKAWITGNASAPPTDDKRANVAYVMATSAQEEAQLAHTAAEDAIGYAETARQAADDAQASADSAQTSADNAQNALKSVVSGAQTVEKAVSVMQTALEAVVDYDPTTDTTQEYFWHDANGAHVLGATSGYRNDIDSTGMKIMNVNTETSVAEFTATGAQIGEQSGSHFAITSSGQSFYADDGTTRAAHIGYTAGSGAWMPNYTFGTRKSGAEVGNYSFAHGVNVSATRYTDHAEGDNTTASGSRSHAEGDSTVASGLMSHAEGNGSIASGGTSHAEGHATIASGGVSHAQNAGTIAQRASQTALGAYNEADTGGTDEHTRGNYVVIIGNGTADDARSNALTVDWSGNVDIASGAEYRVNGTNILEEVKTLVLTTSSISSLPQTVTDSRISADHVVVNSVLSNPSAQTGDWTVTTSDGSLTIAGSISGSTTVTLYLCKSM